MEEGSSTSSDDDNEYVSEEQLRSMPLDALHMIIRNAGLMTKYEASLGAQASDVETAVTFLLLELGA